MTGSATHLLLHVATFTFLQARRSFWRWARSLGGPGIIIAAIIDNSVIPTPGITDALTIVLSARSKNLWIYYAFMATVGALLGGYLTYRMARQGGKATLERYISKEKVGKIEGRFAKWGFGAIAIAAILPPPAPMTPFLLAAGAAQYSLKKFLAALALGRSVRFLLLAFLGARYGRDILRWFSKYSHVILYSFIALAVAGGLYGLYEFLKWRHSKIQQHERPKERKPKAA